MKAFFEEYGFAILAAIVVIALIVIVNSSKGTIQTAFNGIIDTWGEQAKNGLVIPN